MIISRHLKCGLIIRRLHEFKWVIGSGSIINCSVRSSLFVCTIRLRQQCSERTFVRFGPQPFRVSSSVNCGEASIPYEQSEMAFLFSSSDEYNSRRSVLLTVKHSLRFLCGLTKPKNLASFPILLYSREREMSPDKNED